MNSTNQYYIKSLLLLSLCLSSGCGGSGGVATVSVSGVVKLDGTPVEGASVNYFSSNGNFLSTGITDASGKYQLYQGAVVGENKVWISKNNSPENKIPEGADIGEFLELDPAQRSAEDVASGVKPATGPGADVGEQFPEKFSSVEKTVLKFNVPEGGTDSANFDLTKQ